ncbi:transmembrane domain-containing protein TMIGD3-like [Notolabrus celidotus]|uniref:transmembrane domain-containing protein TMIGD3-like n=1 Tax=Notolabrus celidotus TaxID=1203425 RepID=UPI0014906CA9|nr:transmembrane domain-containing protein TMIGD3-like [Notolabrus celidotus]
MMADISMRTISLVVIFLLGGLWETAALTGDSGGEIKIKCSHSYASTNVKYFCRGACYDKDVLISSRKKKKDSNGRYSISDEGNTFFVTISSLTEGDSGIYWCGVDRVGADTYIQVDLTVKRGIEENGLKSNTSSKTLVYIGAGLGVVVLALAIALLIFFRRRNRDAGASSAKVQETIYATVSGDTTTSPSTTNATQKTADSSKDPPSTIYTNITLSAEPQVGSDGLFYSSVSFNKHTDCSTVTQRTAEVTYSAIEPKPEDASVYSNVSQ